MPLLDHFHPPSDRDYPWGTLHTLWCTFLMQALNAKLPEGYRSLATAHLGIEAQVDVATVEEPEAEESEEATVETNGGVATAVWAPPRPPVVLRTAIPDLDCFEIEVLSEALGGRLVAAIELVSPRNKDRPAARRAFAAKVAGYLQRSIGVVVVDIVTDRRNNLHAELMELLELKEQAAGAFDLYTVAYRAIARKKRSRLEVWPTELEVGSPLPTLPLWIASEVAVPVDLEGSYTAALRTFRVR